MAKHEWGTKHTCSNCGAIFYDMLKSPPSCPSCGTKVKPTNRGSPVPQPKVVPEKPAPTKDSIELGGDDALAIGDDPEDKELLEQVEDDVEGDVNEVIETGVGDKTTD